MKCISKSIEYYVLEVKENKDFYIKLGKYLDEKFYEIKTVDEKWGKFEELFLKKDEQKIHAKEKHYILINSNTGNFKYISKDEYETEYVEIVEASNDN